MNTEVVFIIIVVFLVADFIVERILEWVNMRAMAPVLPENLKGIEFFLLLGGGIIDDVLKTFSEL